MAGDLREEEVATAREQVAALAKAIQAGDAETIDRILRPAGDEAKTALLRSPDAEGKTPLIHAAANGDAAIVMVLQQTMRQGGQTGLVAATDKRARTALHYAAEAGHTEALVKLLDMVHAGWLNYNRGIRTMPMPSTGSVASASATRTARLPSTSRRRTRTSRRPICWSASSRTIS